MKVCPTCKATYPDEMVYCPVDGAHLVPADDMSEQQGPKTRAGEVLDEKYRLERLLGAGGMGEVYEARHVYLNKRVAVKLLRAEYTSNPEAVRRFHREAQSSSNIGHENIIEILDFGRLDDGTHYLVMEYLDGIPLSDLIVQGPVELLRGLDIMYQICDGLAAAHREGIVHRDMKPENVFLITTRDGRERVKILDFGIAKVLHGDVDQSLTKTGAIFGTPHYMSPEQAKGEPLDARTDIYSVGIIMYELFTGTVPFKSESFMGILTQHIQAQPPRPSEIKHDLPPIIEEIILKAIQKDPNDRFQSMEEFMEALARAREALSSGRVSAHIVGSDDDDTGRSGFPILPAVIGILFSATVLGGGYYYYYTKKADESGTVAAVSDSELDEDSSKNGSDQGSPMQEKGPDIAMKVEQAQNTMAEPPSMGTESMGSAPSMATQADMVTIRLSTNLDGKVSPPPVFVIDGTKRVESPYTLRIKRGSRVQVVVERDGYKSITRLIAGDSNKRVKLRLKKVRPGSGSAPSSSHRPKHSMSQPPPTRPTLPPPPVDRPMTATMTAPKPKPRPKPRPRPMKPKPMKPDPSQLWD